MKQTIYIEFKNERIGFTKWFDGKKWNWNYDKRKIYKSLRWANKIKKGLTNNYEKPVLIINNN